MASSVSDLPRGCLVHILHFVPLQHRLQSGALVSTAWQEASAAATTSIQKTSTSSLPPLDSARCSALLQWVSTYAHHLSKLELSTPPGFATSADATLLQPPPHALPALQCLAVSGARLQLGAQRSSPNILQSLCGLTELSCSSCSVQVSMQGLSALTALSRLQRLRLDIHVPVMQQSPQPLAHWSLPTVSTWSHLKALTHLDLADQHNVTGAVLEGLTCLTKLQDLQLYAAQLTAPGLAHLQNLTGLQTLRLALAPHLGFSLDSSPWCTPVLAQLPKLQQLSLFCWRELQPAMLASLVPLQHLQLRTWSKHNRPEEVAALLGAVSQLTNLTTLDLREAMLLTKPEEMPLGAAQLGELAPAACAGLTASSALRTLHIHSAELPEGAWLHMFPAGRQLPALKALHLQDITHKLSDSDFEQLVRCATGLTGLTLLMVLHSKVSLDPLLQLTGLRELELWHLHGDSGARVMAQLAGLRRLHNDDANLSPVGLMRLTALKQLTHLHMHYSPDSWSLPRPVKFQNQAPEWLMPDVWSQLLQMLDS